MRLLTQGVERNIMVFMVSNSDHMTGLAGLTLTFSASKDGGAFGAITPSVTDRGDGFYKVVLTTSHTDTLGDLALIVSGGATADLSNIIMQVVKDDLTASHAVAGDAMTLSNDAITSAAIDDGALTAAKFGSAAITSTVAPNLDAAVSTRAASAGTKGTDNIFDGLAAKPTLSAIEGSTILAKDATVAKAATVALDTTVAKDATVAKSAGAKGTDAIFDGVSVHPAMG